MGRAVFAPNRTTTSCLHSGERQLNLLGVFLQLLVGELPPTRLRTQRSTAITDTTMKDQRQSRSEPNSRSFSLLSRYPEESTPRQGHPQLGSREDSPTSSAATITSIKRDGQHETVCTQLHWRELRSIETCSRAPQGRSMLN